MHEHVFLLLSILQKSPFVNLFLENPPNFGYKHNFTPVRLVKRQKRIFFINAPKKVASIRIFCYPCREPGQGFAGGFLQEKKPPSWLWPSRLHHAACGSCCADAEARVPSTYRSICFRQRCPQGSGSWQLRCRGSPCGILSGKRPLPAVPPPVPAGGRTGAPPDHS